MVCGEEVYRGQMWSRDVSFSVSSLPTDSVLGWVIPLQQGFNLEWPKCCMCIRRGVACETKLCATCLDPVPWRSAHAQCAHYSL